MNKPSRIPGFAPDDPTDGRERLEWRSKYEPDALRHIWFESAYLACLLLIIMIAMAILWLNYPKYWLGLTDQKYQRFLKYGIAWLSGVLGGTLFVIKWLYHSVARQMWHLDRRLWRFFTPHISGGLAFAIVALVSSGMFRIFDRQAVESLSQVVGVGFLVGYFSDSAVAKLTEIAETVFGTSRGRERHKDGSKPNGRVSSAAEETPPPNVK